MNVLGVSSQYELIRPPDLDYSKLSFIEQAKNFKQYLAWLRASQDILPPQEFAALMAQEEAKYKSGKSWINSTGLYD